SHRAPPCSPPPWFCRSWASSRCAALRGWSRDARGRLRAARRDRRRRSARRPGRRARRAVSPRKRRGAGWRGPSRPPRGAAAPGRLGVVALLAAPAAGFLVPDAWLRRRARARAAAMARELPDVLDLLRVAVEAGLPVSRALADVGRRHPGALAAELRAAAGAIQLGMPRADALRAVPRRAPLPAVGAMVAAIERSARHGLPPIPISRNPRSRGRNPLGETRPVSRRGESCANRVALWRRVG